MRTRRRIASVAPVVTKAMTVKGAGTPARVSKILVAGRVDPDPILDPFFQADRQHACSGIGPAGRAAFVGRREQRRTAGPAHSPAHVAIERDRNLRSAQDRLSVAPCSGFVLDDLGIGFRVRIRLDRRTLAPPSSAATTGRSMAPGAIGKNKTANPISVTPQCPSKLPFRSVRNS